MANLAFAHHTVKLPSIEKNAATTQGVDLINEIAGTFAQYQADNVDHASRTLDGSGTIHVMGQMATFTPAIKVTRKVPRVEVNMDDLKKVGHVKLVPEINPKAVQGNIIYTKLREFSRDDKNIKLDMLCHFISLIPDQCGLATCRCSIHANHTLARALKSSCP